MNTGLLQVAGVVLQRELRLIVRRWGDATQPVIFFLVVSTLFPLGVTPELAELRQISSGVAWVAAMLSSTLALESLFRADVEDGTMEQWVLSGQPLAWLMLAKTAAHWLTSAVPLVLVAPLAASALGMPVHAWPVLMGSLLIGTAILSLLGSVGAALTVGIRRGSALLALLVLPLEIPVLIFGARAVDLAIHAEPAAGPIKLLLAMLLLSLCLAPLATATAMRVSTET